MKRIYPVLIAVVLSMQACAPGADESTPNAYLDYSETEAELSGGVRLIPISTPMGDFNVWTKRVGNNPDMKVLLLHGGPGATHEYFEAADSYFPSANVEYYYYDQLGSFYSDQPDMTGLLTTEHFVEEVEQVRQALGLTKDNFYLLGHSWGGILGIEYALKYQDNLKGLIISNMMSSGPEYGKYALEVLGPRMAPEVLAEIQEMEANEDFGNPRYSELLTAHYYTEHVLRMPLEDWPEPVNRSFANMNADVYVPMQGPSEFGLRGVLETWDRSGDLPDLSVPTLVVGAEHDTMDPVHMEWMSTQVQNGRYLYCPNGSHMAMYDDQKTYFAGVIQFIHDVNLGTF